MQEDAETLSREAEADSSRERGGKWVTLELRLSPMGYSHFAEGVELALEKMAVDGIRLPATKEKRVRLALDFIMSEFTVETAYWMTQFYMQARDSVRDADERMGKIAALRRDEWRCRRCGHTRVNEEGVMIAVHHIIPKGYLPSPRDRIPRPKDIHSSRNLISLCSLCHEAVHADWREAAVELFGILKDYQMVKLFEKCGYGAKAVSP